MAKNSTNSDISTLELVKLAQEGDADARERIIKENAGLVWSIARRFTSRGYELDDLYQIGAIGLIKCIEKFDMTFGVKFSTYAVPMILGEIKRFLRDDGIIKVSRPLKEMAAKAKYMQETLQHKLGKPPTVNELATALDTDVSELILAMESSFEIESLHQTIGQGEGNPVYLIDKLDNAGTGGGDDIEDIIALKQIINRLDKKDRAVIVMRYFQDKTQTEVAKAIGVSQVQVSRIEKKALEMIREMMVSR